VPGLAPGEARRVRFTVPVAGPLRLWRPGRPELYAATIQARVGDDVQQEVDQAVGLRSIAVRAGGLTLNGRQVDLRGASLHEDVPGHGAALTEADMDAYVAQLQALHATVTRAHYAMDARLLDRLDRAGILVWAQAPIYHRDASLRSAEQRAAALATLRGTILSVRTHPSVITTSVANELSAAADKVAGTRQYLDAARRLERDLDPTRPPAVDILGWPTYPRQEVFGRFPLLGVNCYFGWYPGHPPRFSTADLSGLRPFLERMHAKYPGTALVMTEFGAEANRTGAASRKSTFAFQSAFIRRTLDVVDALPFLSGAIYWTLREFAIRPGWDGGANLRSAQRDAFHHKGLLGYDGAPKPAFAVAARRFAAVPLFRPTLGALGPGRS
jgi:beta-glucuronidase